MLVRSFHLIYFLSFWLVLSILIPVGISQEVPPATLAYNPSQNYVITFIDYDSDLIDLNLIESNLPSNYLNTLNYDINYDIQISNSSYSNLVNSYIDSVAETDWTSDLNRTALEEQKVNFERKDIFIQKEGVAIDARKLEDFLHDNPVETELEDNNLFRIYVLNLSRFDTETTDHWLNVTEVDVDSSRARFYWRLEWDYDLNFDVRFPYAAFSESSEDIIIDLTAFQWYLEWRAIWNIGVNDHPSYFDDLDRLIEGDTNQEINNIVTETAIVWLNDWINNVYNMPIIPEELNAPLSIQILAPYYGSEIGLSNIDWIINENYVGKTIFNLLRSNQIEVTINYVNMEEDEFISDLVAFNEISYSTYSNGDPSPFEDWTYYNGEGLWGEVFSNPTLNSNYYDNNAAEIVVKGLIMLVDNSSFVGPTPWTGGLYTGLGGNRILTILYELDRALMADHETRKSGLSRVIIHEVGHAIGIPHTFTNSFTSDFISDVMGYYPGTANYSQIITKIYHRSAADLKFARVISKYQNLFGSRSNDVLMLASSIFNQAIDSHKNKDYLQSYFELLQVENVLDNSLVTTTSTTPTSLTTSSTSSTTSSTSSTTPTTDSTITETTTKSNTSNSPFNLYLSILGILVLFIFIKKMKLYNHSKP